MPKNRIIELLNHPSELEQLYRESPQEFVSLLADAISEQPGSELRGITVTLY